MGQPDPSVWSNSIRLTKSDHVNLLYVRLNFINIFLLYKFLPLGAAESYKLDL